MAGVTIPKSLTLRRAAALSAALYLALYLAWLAWGRNIEGERSLLANFSMLFTSLAALTFAVYARRRLEDAQLRRAWKWLVVGLACWCLQDLLRLFLQAAFASLVFNPLDILYSLGLAALCGGLFLLPRRPRQHPVRLLLYFDTTLTSAALVTLVWMSVLQPLFANPARALVILSPLADLLILILILNLFVLSEADRLAPAFGWICLGLLAFTLSDLAHAGLLAVSVAQPATAADFGWALGDAFLALAALLANRPAREENAAASRRRALVARFQSLLPMLATVSLGGYALLAWYREGLYNPLGFYMTIILGLGLIARQSVLTGEIEYQKYANLVNSIAEPAFVCDRQGKLQLINRALVQAAGYDSPAGLLSLPVQQLFTPADNLENHLSRNPDQPWHGELSLVRLDKSLLPVTLALRPLVPQAGRAPFGRSFALAGTAHDLSEIKRQQTALQAAYEQIASDRTELERLNVDLEAKVTEKTADLSAAYKQVEEQNIRLRELDEIKSDFVSLVSHELRAPLTNINGGIELLLAKTRRLPPASRQDLELVQAEIRRLTRFVETILDLSALEAGKLPLYPAPLALRSVSATLEIQMEHLPGVERVAWNIPDDLPSLLADEQALVSVLFHLLDNAIKYAPQGPITVSAGMVDSQVWIEVRDEGPGIPTEALPWLFERFYRSNATDAQSVYGHGLGLYIVRRLLEAMDGAIEACNHPQGGACFTLHLPVME